MTDKHIYEHMQQIANRYYQHGGSGMSANLYAAFFGVKPQRILRILKARHINGWLCGDTGAIMYNPPNSNTYFSGGWDEDGAPINAETVWRRSLKDAKLGAGSIEWGARQSAGQAAGYARHLGLKIIKKETSDAKCVYCHAGRKSGSKGLAPCPDGCDSDDGLWRVLQD